MRVPSTPLRSLRTLASSASSSALPFAPSSSLLLQTSFRSLSTNTPSPPTPRTGLDASGKKIVLKYDPSIYLYLRPKHQVGIQTSVKEDLPPWFHALVRPLVQAMRKSSKQGTAIEATRNFVGQASDGLVRNEDFFWTDCQLPRTMQAWFSVHMLLLLMYIPRLRALPKKEAKRYQEELLTHFFSLLEVRMRRTLGPLIPERFVKKYMIEFGEQFTGYRITFDQAILGNDTELALFLWRNVFGARGLAKGTVGVKIPSGLNDRKRVEHLSKIGKADGMGGKIRPQDLEGKMEGEGRIGPVPTDLKSPPMLGEIPETWDPCLMPEELNQLVGFVRREMSRLQTIPDEVILRGGIGTFGPVREEDAKVWDDIMRERAIAFIQANGTDEVPIREDMRD
ncbi:ubiquinol-cytochrome C chaperone-domain-containing protein [Mrakia frigida]|uniref:Cbp3p n=1 Tax=Mrakia frigida TaxID=29902 RepID=UPI003FCC0AEE